MTYILLDTSTSTSTFVIVENDERLLDEQWAADRELAEKLLRYTHGKLAGLGKDWADLTGIGFMKGPGSFTGLRIGASIVNTLAVDLRIPIVGVMGDEWQSLAISRLNAGENDKIVMPEYGRPANVTTPRK